jgi:hypothetical protein
MGAGACTLVPVLERTVPTALDRELLKLLTGTNDQRRRVGQTLYHFYRTLIFWMPKGRTFLEITRAWSAGGAAVFDTLATTLDEIGEPSRDERLRAFTGRVLVQLADDLERGDRMLVPYLRWLETLFPELTEMIRQEDVGSRIYDVDLARELGSLFAAAPDASREDLVRSLRACGHGFADSSQA